MFTTRLKPLLASAIVVLPLAATGALAQEQPATPNATQTMPDTAPSDAPTTMPDTAPAEISPDKTTPTETAPAAAMDGIYLQEQKPGQISANTFIGKAVYNASDESIGDINDLIIDADSGGAIAAVIGVGGFLGIGEKQVAVSIDTIKAEQDPQTGDLRLTTTETVDSLKAAPDFKSLAMISAEKLANMPVTAPTTDQTSTSQTPATPQ